MVRNPSTPIEDQPEPPRLRFLRRLVIVMTVTMIVGLFVIIVLMIMTFMGTRTDRTSVTEIKDPLQLPDGESARAYTQGTGWSAVVTRDNNGQERIHIFDPATGAIRQTIDIE